MTCRCRCHGGEGTWLPVALECVGFTKVQVVVDMYTGGGLWESLDPKRYPLKKTGMVSVALSSLCCNR